MADSVSTEAWLDQRRWAALEEALKAQGSNVKRHLQDYLITLYNETVPLERWVQIETAITKEELGGWLVSTVTNICFIIFSF